MELLLRKRVASAVEANAEVMMNFELYLFETAASKKVALMSGKSCNILNNISYYFPFTLARHIQLIIATSEYIE